MTRAFVADVSVAVGWVHPAQAAKQTTAMLDAIADGATLEVPALWPLEVANALIVLARRRKLAEDERHAALGWLRVRVDHEMSELAFARLSELAAAHQLSVYDAAYLELAAQACLGVQGRPSPCRSQARGGHSLGLTSTNALCPIRVLLSVAP